MPSSEPSRTPSSDSAFSGSSVRRPNMNPTSVATNIAAYPFAPIQVVINPSTSDARFTPELRRVKLLWESDIEFQEEYVARSLLPELRETLRPIAELDVKVAAGTTTIDLNSIETPYNVESVDAVYNMTADPERRTDIFQGYVSGTKIVTFAAPGATSVIRVRFVYAPVVAIATDQDFTELAKVPAIVLESIDETYGFAAPTAEHVINRETGEGWQLDGAWTADINITIRWVADKTKDADRLGGAVRQFFCDRILRARGQDEFFAVYTIEDYNHQPGSNQSSLHSGTLRARICNTVSYQKDAVQVTAVKRFVVTGGNLEFQV